MRGKRTYEDPTSAFACQDAEFASSIFFAEKSLLPLPHIWYLFLRFSPPPPILNGSSPLASYKACFSFLQSSIGTCAYTGKDSPFLLPIIQALALLCLSVEASLNSHTHCVNFCIFPTLCWLFMLTTFSTV